MATRGRSRTRRGQVQLVISNFNNWTKERLSTEIKLVTGVNLNASSTPRNVLIQVYRDNVGENSARTDNINVGVNSEQRDLQNLQQTPNLNIIPVASTSTHDNLVVEQMQQTRVDQYHAQALPRRNRSRSPIDARGPTAHVRPPTTYNMAAPTEQNTKTNFLAAF